jgi:hypothetical protein
VGLTAEDVAAKVAGALDRTTHYAPSPALRLAADPAV